MTGFTESIVEEAALAVLGRLGWAVLHGPEIAIGTPAAERSDPGYRDVILARRLQAALARVNPALPAAAVDDAFRRLTRVAGPTLIERNRALHRMLVDGVTVEYRRPDGSIAGAQARVVDFEVAEANDWLAVNQLTVVDGGHERRPDVVLFVNGLPVAVIELKNPADEQATIHTAYRQLVTYQAQIPALFEANAVLVTSDGTTARIGALGAGEEWFKPWRTIEGSADAPSTMPELRVLLEGVFEHRRFLDLVRHFVVFEDAGGGAIAKKIAGYHQFHAVNAAVEETIRATGALSAGHLRAAEEHGRYETPSTPGGEHGDRRVGVIWHTQPRSLQAIRRELAADRGIALPANGSLGLWAKHGILLLNTALTVQVEKPRSHRRAGWTKLTDAIIKLVAERDRPVAFLLWGVHAQAKAHLIDGERHVIVCSPHPSPLAKARGQAFDGSHPFSRADQGLVLRGAAPIDWALQ